MVTKKAIELTVTNIKEVRLSRTIQIPMGGTQPPTLYTNIPCLPTKDIENKERRNKERVAKLDKESEKFLTLFPKRETRNAVPNGMATKRGNRL